jgi:hypothetical protein
MTSNTLAMLSSDEAPERLAATRSGARASSAPSIPLARPVYRSFPGEGAAMASGSRVIVELFGVPRLRAGVAEVALEAATLADLLAGLADRFPALSLRTPDGRLSPHYRLSLDGQRFLDDLDEALPPGARVLLLSADVGG